MVTVTYAIVYPLAVMVESFYAFIADIAMS